MLLKNVAFFLILEIIELFGNYSFGIIDDYLLVFKKNLNILQKHLFLFYTIQEVGINSNKTFMNLLIFILESKKSYKILITHPRFL